MKGLTFVLSGETAIFKKPDVNSYAYFTYNNIHKIALLGILGAVIGLGGYNQRGGNNDKAARYPEFYEKLKDLKVSVVPLSDRGYFQKKVQVFNNSVGYASKETGGNLIVREQWLEKPKWEIFLLKDNSIEPDIFNKIEENLLNRKCEFIPYLGKNDHIANINNVKIIELIETNKPTHLNSLFITNEVRLDDEFTYDDKNPFILKEMLPFRLNEEYNFYEFKELGFTNLEIAEIFELKDVYQYDDRFLHFI